MLKNIKNFKKHRRKSRPKVSQTHSQEEESLLKSDAQEKEPSYRKKRFWVVYAAIFFSVFYLVRNVTNWQIIQTDEMVKKADEKSLYTQILPSTRAKILDRNHRLLAVSQPLYNVYFDPRYYFDSRLQRSASIIRLLADETGVNKADIDKEISRYIRGKNNRNNDEAKSFALYQFNAKSLDEVDSKEYWDLLHNLTGISREKLYQVRTNPASEFVRLEREIAGEHRALWRFIADEADVPYNELMARVYSNAQRQHLIIKDNLSYEVASNIIGLSSRKSAPSLVSLNEKNTLPVTIVGLRMEKKFRRFYPLAEKSAQLVGFLDHSGKAVEGIERYFNEQLLGKNGKERYRKDKKGQVIELLEMMPAQDAPDIVLSIDEELQSIAYEELKKAVIMHKAKGGAAVMISVATGEVLVMANFALSAKDRERLNKIQAPKNSKEFEQFIKKHNFETFNPNNSNTYKVGLARNSAIYDVFEPGSTVKPFVMLQALKNNVVSLNSVLSIPGYFAVDGKQIKDPIPKPELGLREALKYSSNIFVSTLSLQMPSTTLPELYTRLGFGESTGLGMGEAKGFNGLPKQRMARIDQANLSFGYGLNVTPLQLARAYAALGAYGYLRPVSLLKVTPPVLGEQLFSERYAREILHMMESVTEKGGTGTRAKVDGYRVAVKTGTATKYIEKVGYGNDNIAFIAGIAPLSNPRYSLVVMIDEPSWQNERSGGVVSGPVFAQIMEKTLKSQNIMPDGLEHAVE